MANDVGELLVPVFELLELLWLRLHGRLPAAETARARGLLLLLRSPGDDPRAYCRTEVEGRVHLIPKSGPVVIGSVLDLGAGGLRLAARRVPPPGTRAVAHLTDPGLGLAFTFPVVVAWSVSGTGARAGLRFAGRPRLRGATRKHRLAPPAWLRRERPTVAVRAWPHSIPSASSYSTEQTG